jgi:integrase
MSQTQVFPYVFSTLSYTLFLMNMYMCSHLSAETFGRKNIFVLTHIAQNWQYWKDQRFFNTCLAILLTGCRISEVATINTTEINDQVDIGLYCKKQGFRRSFLIHKSTSTVLFNDFFNKGHYYLNEREFNRRFKRFFPLLHQIALKRGIHAGSHVLRHVHVSVALTVAGATRESIRVQMGWKTLDMVDAYAKLSTDILV